MCPSYEPASEPQGIFCWTLSGVLAQVQGEGRHCGAILGKHNLPHKTGAKLVLVGLET